MGQVKLRKEDTTKKERTIYMNPNWIKFFLADFFIAAGIDCASNNIVFVGIFCIVAGMGLGINMLYEVTKDW